MDTQKQNPNNDNQSYEATVSALSQTVTAKIFEQALASDKPGEPTLVESEKGNVYALTGYTGENGPETVIDTLTGSQQRYVIDAQGIVWDSGVDSEPQKTPQDVVARLNGTLARATAVNADRRSEFIVAEEKAERGYLDMGVVTAESMPKVPGGYITEAESRRISRDNNRGFFAKMGNVVTEAFIGKPKS